MITLDTLKEDRFRGEFPKLPICLLLAGTHLFVKEEALKLSGWIDKTVYDRIDEMQLAKASKKKTTAVDLSGVNPVNGVPFIHAFNDKKEEGGLSFPNPKMHILASSPRLVEVTDNGAKAGLGRKGAIIGNYEFPEGFEIHDSSDRELNLTTLRTLHMIYLVGSDNQLLHKVPLVLSVHGGAATIFGKQSEMFYKLLELALTEHFGDSFYSLSAEARASAIFQPTFGIEAVGKIKSSDVCSVVDFVEPTVLTVEEHFNFLIAQKLWDTRKSLGNFATRYMQQFEDYHAIAPGVELDRFPENPDPMPEEVKLLQEQIRGQALATDQSIF